MLVLIILLFTNVLSESLYSISYVSSKTKVKHFGHSNPSASTCFGFIPARKPPLGYSPTPIQFFKVKDSLHSGHLYGKFCSLKPEKSNIIILPYIIIITLNNISINVII